MTNLTKIHIAKLRREDRQEPGNRLRHAMELAGVTQQEVANALGLSQSYISDTVCGRYETVTVSIAHRFAQYFGVAIEDLFPMQGGKRG